MATQAPHFDPTGTVNGELPPWEIAKAFAFHVVIKTVAEQLATPAHELLGQRADDYISNHVVLKGGGHPCARAIRKIIARCSNPEWFPGQRTMARKGAGRPPTFSENQKNEAARVAMDLKRKLIAPTPRRVRARLPKRLINIETESPMSDRSLQRIFATRCYDEDEDDPWQFLDCLSQDALPEELKPKRVTCGREILKRTTARSWHSHIAIDPCYSLLAKTMERLEEQKIAAMGKKRWRSKGAARKSVDMRAPSTTNTQGGHYVTRVDWTPVFARGRVFIYVVDAEAAARNDSLPTKLNDATNLAKFVSNVLPNILQEMQMKYKWADVPRVVVHDKASYMVTAAHERLHVKFAAALRSAGFRSWVGGEGSDSTEWLVKKWGDVYPHETLISHIRRLLNTDFLCNRLCETPTQFTERMMQVQNHLNSADFAHNKGAGLEALAKELRPRCLDVVNRRGERIPK